MAKIGKIKYISNEEKLRQKKFYLNEKEMNEFFIKEKIEENEFKRIRQIRQEKEKIERYEIEQIRKSARKQALMEKLLKEERRKLLSGY